MFYWIVFYCYHYCYYKPSFSLERIKYSVAIFNALQFMFGIRQPVESKGCTRVWSVQKCRNVSSLAYAERQEVFKEL